METGQDFLSVLVTKSVQMQATLDAIHQSNQLILQQSGVEPVAQEERTEAVSNDEDLPTALLNELVKVTSKLDVLLSCNARILAELTDFDVRQVMANLEEVEHTQRDRRFQELADQLESEEDRAMLRQVRQLIDQIRNLGQN